MKAAFRVATAACVLALFVAGCSSTTSTGGGGTTAGSAASASRTLRVPADYPTIQAAVDAAAAGDLVLISPGVYKEAVVVQTDDIVIRGLDRNEVVIDGEFERDNGIKVFSNGVAVENLTSRNHKGNGVFFTGDYDAKFVLTGYRMSYITAYNNGDYGLYAFNATKGLIEHSYGSGHPDSAFYIGQCNPCDAVLRDSIGENNLLGYSGTNSSTNTYIVNNEFRNNRSGIVPNTQDGEKLKPQQDAVIAGNWVHDNNNPATPQKNVDYSIAFGTGIVLVGTQNDLVTKNLVENNRKTGIVVFVSPFTEPVTEPAGNRVIDNVVSGAEQYADIVLALGDTSKGALGNCVSGNRAATYRPAEWPEKVPCTSTTSGTASTGWNDFEGVDVASLTPGPPPVDYKTVPPPPPQPSMPDAATAPARPARPADLPLTVDVGAITLPTGNRPS